MTRRRSGFIAFVSLLASLGLSSEIGRAQTCQACALVLDPQANQAFTSGNGAQVALSNCGIHVNSKSTSAFYATGGARVNASSIQVVGGSSIVNNASVTPVPQGGTAAGNDPFAAVPAPAVGSCTSHPDYTSWGQNGHYEIYPGTYCGGLTVSNGVTAHFNPGVYVINGGGVHFGSGSVSGTGVTFYITGTSFTNNQVVSIANGESVSLTAPTSGTYQGILFFQDRSISNTALSSLFAGGASMSLTGSLYFPTTALTFNNGSGSTGNTALIARTIDFEGGVGIKLNPSSAQVLPPVSVSVSPATAALHGGQTQQFTAVVSGGCSSAVTWTLTPATGAGAIDAAGLYTAPAMITAIQTVTVTATSQSDTTKTATATITLLPPVAVSVSPATATLYGGQTQQFTASVDNTGNSAVTWTLSPATGAGSISATGLYTAPATISSTQKLTVTATSQADITKSATATVTLLPVLAVTPTTATLYGGGTQPFTANQSVTWTLTPATGAGTITSGGLYTAPASVTAQQAVTVTATSQADITKSATATVTLLPVLAVTPATATLYGGGTQQFAANQSVTWTLTPATGAGTITSVGRYTGPASVSAQQAVTVTATSVADPTKSVQVPVTLLPVLAVTPTTATLYGGGTQPFTANQSVTWTLTPATGAGTITSGGLYTAPASVTAQQAVTVTATSQADITKSATATVTLLPVLAVTPTTATLYGGGTQPFTANQSVTWTLTPATGAGTITSGGLYTAPASVTAQQAVTVTATGVADPAKSVQVPVTLLAALAVTPTAATLYGGGTQQFAANQSVTWTLTPATGAGTITSGGLYTAPASVTAQQAVTVTATSVADPTKSEQVPVTLLAPAVVDPIVPNSGEQGQGPLSVQITGQYTHFGADSAVSFGTPGVKAGTVTVTDATHLTVDVTIDPTAALGTTSVTVTTDTEIVTDNKAFTVTPGNVYAHRRSITIDHTKVPHTDQANFPVLISGAYPFLATTNNGGDVRNANGYDIIFTSDYAGTTKLDHEIESYDPKTGTIGMWVRIPMLSHTCDTVIYVVYGNGAVASSQENKAGVWDSNFQAVLHLSDSAGT